MKRTRKTAMLCAVMALVLATTVACSSASGADRAFQVAFCSPAMNSDAIDAYGEKLVAEIPALAAEETAPVFTPIYMGETENDPEQGIGTDPMMTMGGMMKFTAMIASGEVDVVVSDMENASRNAQSGAFMPLDEVFTAEELAAITAEQLSFDMLEYDGEVGVPTGEKTPACGFDVSGSEALAAIFGDQQLGVFIAEGTKDVELAKQVVLSMLS